MLRRRLDVHHSSEIACRHGVHVGQDQGLGEIVPVRFLVLFAHDGKGVEDGGRIVVVDGVEMAVAAVCFIPRERRAAISYVLKR